MSRILIIEDDPSVQDLYGDMLSESGFEISAALDGQEGLEMAKKGGYDLILLDIVMPKLDGMEFLARLKDNPSLQKNGPVVILTNVDEDESVKKALSLGARGYIVKANINPEQFVFEVNRYLKS